MEGEGLFGAPPFLPDEDVEATVQPPSIHRIFEEIIRDQNLTFEEAARCLSTMETLPDVPNRKRKMSSVICQNFVQNAWKKELCSNCFKSKDEHASKPKPKPVQTVAKNKIGGIIKTTKKDKKLTVAFTKDLTQVIGFGGEDWNSEDEEEIEENNDEIDDDDDDFASDSDDDESTKQLRKLTKENTDFNTVSLGDVIEVKKSYTQLLLGKPILDAEGKKQTLLVTVTPFGEEPKQRSFKPTNIAKNNKESAVENKSNIVLTSYTKNEENKTEKSLLDEISETLEKGSNPIQIMSRKKAHKEIVLNLESNKENIDDEKKENNDEKSEKKASSLTRTPALIKKDSEKPIYQTSTAKIELLNSRNSKLSEKGSNEVNNNETKSISVVDKTIVTTADFIKTERLNSSKQKEIIEETPKRKNETATKIVPKYPVSNLTVSREQAGRPDGREDPETSNELPALPLTPPPVFEGQNSFLHAPTPFEKPKIPSKPVSVVIRKPPASVAAPTIKQQPLSTFVNKPPLAKQDSNSSDAKLNKRQAPRPPDEPLYARNSPTTVNGDSPVVREKEKRERASSCVPKMGGVCAKAVEELGPEPAPRKSLSVSTDNLAGDDKRKDKSKARFSLKKFLRMGGAKESVKIATEAVVSEPMDHPQPKPRLVIVHPTELDGAKVEVLSKPPIDQIDFQRSPKSTKPPPPPRNYESVPKSIVHPPKSVEVLNKQLQVSRSNSSNGAKKTESVYANIGEVRSALVPNKPVRTASMREREAQQQKQLRKSHYETVNVKQTENVYEYVNTSGRSSSPESDSSRGKNSPKTKVIRMGKRSESSVDVTGDCFKYGNIPRSMSLTYCGSETESEIYSPYSFYGSESEVTEDDHDWSQTNRTHKLRSRKGRSIVHKNLEDNYGAVVVANHEALAQVLENVQQTSHVQPALRGLRLTANLRWGDFTNAPGAAPTSVGRSAFHQVLWGAQRVTLAATVGVSSAGGHLGTFGLNPVTEFSDLVPGEALPKARGDSSKGVQATISVLPWVQVNTIETYGELLRSKASQGLDEAIKECNFVVLQLVNALKMLQAQGIEELPLSLESFVLLKEVEREVQHRLCILQSLSPEVSPVSEEEKYGSLCACASKAILTLNLPSKITPLILSLLNNERAVSLTQVKSVLEFSLWGPTDVSLGSTVRERELALQRWLDLQRATVLHGLVCARVQLTVYEECHLLFLVRSNARMMCDASMLIESSNVKHVHSSKA